jgi:hypothetical protein
MQMTVNRSMVAAHTVTSPWAMAEGPASSGMVWVVPMLLENAPGLATLPQLPLKPLVSPPLPPVPIR